MRLLTAEGAAAYWDARHQRESDLRSGGDLTYDETGNQVFHTLRLGMLLDIIGHDPGTAPSRSVLDAGCGKGWFSRALARHGYRVDAFDPSEAALARCRAHGGGVRYYRSTLSGWRTARRYDVVVSVDVAFHILDHGEWERSMRNLASLVRPAGRLVVSDWGGGGDRVCGDYQVVRGRDRYLPLLRECGLCFDEWRPYAFRHNDIGFWVFTRTGVPVPSGST